MLVLWLLQDVCLVVTEPDPRGKMSIKETSAIPMPPQTPSSGKEGAPPSSAVWVPCREAGLSESGKLKITGPASELSSGYPRSSLPQMPCSSPSGQGTDRGWEPSKSNGCQNTGPPRTRLSKIDTKAYTVGCATLTLEGRAGLFSSRLFKLNF